MFIGSASKDSFVTYLGRTHLMSQLILAMARLRPGWWLVAGGWSAHSVPKSTNILQC